MQQSEIYMLLTTVVTLTFGDNNHASVTIHLLEAITVQALCTAVSD